MKCKKLFPLKACGSYNCLVNTSSLSAAQTLLKHPHEHSTMSAALEMWWQCVYLLHNLSAAPSLSLTSVGKILTVITLVGAGKMDLFIVQDLMLQSHGVPIDRWLRFIALSRLFPENCLGLDKALERQMVVCVSVYYDRHVDPDVCNPSVTLKIKDLFWLTHDSHKQSVIKLWLWWTVNGYNTQL